MRRRLTALIGLGAIVAGLLTGIAATTTSSEAQAANAQDFIAGNIISDQAFWNPNTMNVADIQSFLDSQVPRCASGANCLKNYSQATRDIAATPMCSAYQGAASESAATIIYKVAQSCGVNPRVILVMLQKEQGLITSTNPTQYMYRSAMGAGCPDTAACDANYYGFFNQVQYGAYLLKRYTQPPGTGPGTDYYTRYDRMYPVGQTSYIQYNPNSSCGGQNVYIENQATHALYVYTPYTPTQAALNAGYGYADNCSAYGNRNFFLYYTDWFGTTQPFPVTGDIGARWNSLGGYNSYLGTPLGNQVCNLRNSGCYQQFRNGYIVYSPATGARDMNHTIRNAWGDQGYESGTLGYPITSLSCVIARGGCWQQFEGGFIMWSPSTGAQVVETAMRSGWADLGFESGALGYPTDDKICGLVRGGCYQPYEGGTVVGTPTTGYFGMTPAFHDAWGTVGFEGGSLGYPLSSSFCGLANGGCWQRFENGYLISSPAGGMQILSNAVRNAWVANGAEGGQLGYPTSAATCSSSGVCSQPFQGGNIHWSSSTSPQAVLPVMGARWGAEGAGAGWLGFPTNSTACGLRDSGCWQQFQNGFIVSSASTGAQTLRPEFRAEWANQGFEGGWLGYPTSSAVCGLTGGGCYQVFQGGHILWSPSAGAKAIRPVIRDRWAIDGYEGGWLGYPVNSTQCGLRDSGCWQQFQNGFVVSSAAGGAQDLSPDFRTRWGQEGFEGGWLGYPVTSWIRGLRSGGSFQQFQGGFLIASPATGVQPVSPLVRDRWGQNGFENGYLGYPTGPLAPSSNGNQRQDFQGGYILVYPNGTTQAF